MMAPASWMELRRDGCDGVRTLDMTEGEINHTFSTGGMYGVYLRDLGFGSASSKRLVVLRDLI